MNHDEFEHLADSAFDGRDDAPVRARIESLAASDHELRGRWEDLQAARTGLAGAGLEPLPAGLHEALIEDLRTAAPRGGVRMSWLSFVTAAIQTRPIFALGGAVAAGLAIGVFGFGLIMGGPRAGQDLAPGTSASLPPMPAAVARTTLDQGGVHVELTSRRAAGKTTVRLDARGGGNATLTLVWEPTMLRLSGVRWEGPDAPQFATGPGRVVLQTAEATGSELSFDEIVASGSVVRVTLSAAGGDREVSLRIPR